MKRLFNPLVYTLLALWLATIIALIMTAVSKPQPKPADPGAPANATMRIISADRIDYTNAFNFDDKHKCVVFVALPTGQHSMVCGNFRLEGLNTAPTALQ